ncbi:hypothetical protein HY312_03375 [Candidatus Saccharibacteria bacterium]|nr:hypothetical protein [Candidatus Saccharibacteria bacterium]
MPMTVAITYKQDGGGTPAVNSLATFVQNRTMASEYALRKFNNPSALDAVLEKYDKESL